MLTFNHFPIHIILKYFQGKKWSKPSPSDGEIIPFILLAALAAALLVLDVELAARHNN